MSEAQAQGQATPSGAEAPTHPEAQPEAEKSFNQADVRKIGANEKREGRASEINDLLKETGAESRDDVVSGYLEYLEIQEAVTSEADKANQRAEKLEARAKAAEERYTNTLREFALRDALRDSGINPERLKGAMRLADMSALEVDKEGSVTGLEDVVASVQEDSPEWFGQAERPRINAPQTTGTGVSTPGTTQDPAEAHANWLLGILDP